MLNDRKLYLYRLIAGIMPDGWRFQWLRTKLLRWCGAEIGKGVYFSARVRFEGGGRLILEDGVWIGPYTLLSPSGCVDGNRPTIRICKNTWVAHMCSLKTKTHEIDVNGPSVGGKTKIGDIVVGEGSWVCAMVTIIPGVTIGRRSVIAAGAVVIRSCLDGALLAGVPAERKRDVIAR